MSRRYVIVRGEVENLATAARALLIEIDAARGLRVGHDGILDPLHPICVHAEEVRRALRCPSFQAPDG